jgi:hypothetical protein
MPIWLRRFTFNKIKEHYDNENQSGNKDVVTQNRNTLKTAGATSEKQKINIPSYTIKASKK